MERVKEKEYFKIYQRVFDTYTLNNLAQLIRKGMFRSVDFPIATGKEADVYRGTTAEGGHVALKIYRIETTYFRNMWGYIAGDRRFQRVKRDRRSITNTWCQKEYRNLMDAVAAGVRVPKPIKAFRNVLVMEFIGTEGMAAPLLKYVKPENPENMVSKLAEYVSLLYKKAGLVHGDLSEFNVMVLDGEPVLIDIGQGVKKDHPLFNELVKRDLENLGRIAKKLGVPFKGVSLD